jgi:hypothetical protein
MNLIEPQYLRWAPEAFQVVRISRELDNYPFGKPSRSRGVTPLTIGAFYLAMDETFDASNVQHLTPDLLQQDIGIPKCT